MENIKKIHWQSFTLHTIQCIPLGLDSLFDETTNYFVIKKLYFDMFNE